MRVKCDDGQRTTFTGIQRDTERLAIFLVTCRTWDVKLYTHSLCVNKVVQQPQRLRPVRINYLAKALKRRRQWIIVTCIRYTWSNSSHKV